MLENFDPHFATRRFDRRILSCSGTTASGLEEESSDFWKQEDADITFVGFDGSLFSVETKFDPTRKNDGIVWWSAFQNKHWSDPARCWVYLSDAHDLLNQSAIVFSSFSISESARDLERRESLASAYANIWRINTPRKLEAIHPITKSVYERLDELPATSMQ